MMLVTASEIEGESGRSGQRRKVVGLQKVKYLIGRPGYDSIGITIVSFFTTPATTKFEYSLG